jgi:hypothetical protein
VIAPDDERPAALREVSVMFAGLLRRKEHAAFPATVEVVLAIVRILLDRRSRASVVRGALAIGE